VGTGRILIRYSNKLIKEIQIFYRSYEMNTTK